MNSGAIIGADRQNISFQKALLRKPDILPEAHNVTVKQILSIMCVHYPLHISPPFILAKKPHPQYCFPHCHRTGRDVLLEELSRELDRDETELHALELQRMDEVDRGIHDKSTVAGGGTEVPPYPP